MFDVDKLEIPNNLRKVSISKEQSKIIIDYCSKLQSNSNTLEIGLAYAGSACAILSANKSQHFAIDPNQTKDKYLNIGLKNIKSCGFDDRFNLIAGSSEFELPKLLISKTKFKLIYIDGNHEFEQVALDFYYCDKILEVGGYLIFDDNIFLSIKLVTNHIKKTGKIMNYVHQNMVLLYLKKSKVLILGIMQTFIAQLI